MPVPWEWQRLAFFPKSNRRSLTGSGAVLAWRVGPWLKVDGNQAGTRRRMVQAAAFVGADLACFIELQQVKNGLKDEVEAEAFAQCLDAHSEQLGKAGMAICESVLLLAGRDWIEPGEVFTEVCTLYVPEGYKGKKVWAEALPILLKRLTPDAPGGVRRMVCVLEIGPLEEWWRARAQDKPGEAGAADVDGQGKARVLALGQRRQRAMKKLYANELGFEQLQIATTWMGKLVRS